MSIGANWMRAARRAAAAAAARMIAAAERELGGLLPGARIERSGTELRIRARGLLRRWIADPALRFLGWRLK